jgi:hypothetical protein
MDMKAQGTRCKAQELLGFEALQAANLRAGVKALRKEGVDILTIDRDGDYPVFHVAASAATQKMTATLLRKTETPDGTIERDFAHYRNGYSVRFTVITRPAAHTPVRCWFEAAWR